MSEEENSSWEEIHSREGQSEETNNDNEGIESRMESTPDVIAPESSISPSNQSTKSDESKDASDIIEPEMINEKEGSTVNETLKDKLLIGFDESMNGRNEPLNDNSNPNLENNENNENKENLNINDNVNQNQNQNANPNPVVNPVPNANPPMRQQIPDNGGLGSKVLFGAVMIFLIAIISKIRPNPSPTIIELECPSENQYFSAELPSIIIKSGLSSHPEGTTYSYQYPSDVNGIFFGGHDTNEFTLAPAHDKVFTPVSFTIKLKLEIDNDKYIGTSTCNMNVKIRDVPILGIDLGTTYSCVGYQTLHEDSGVYKSTKRKLDIVELDETNKEYCIPTCVYFPSNGKPAIVGYEARAKLSEDPMNTFCDLKRMMGRRKDDIELRHFKESHKDYILSDDELPKLYVPNRDEWYSPEEMLSAVVAHIVRKASSIFDTSYIKDVVISVPAYFHNGQRKAVRSIAKLVNLNPLHLVVEPTSAALNHWYYHSKPDDNFKHFLVFDFGGGTIDCSVMHCSGYNCHVLSVEGADVGGIDFDRVLREIILSNLKNDIIVSDESKSRLLLVSERLKKGLTEKESQIVTCKTDEMRRLTECELNEQQINDNTHHSFEITREKFESNEKVKELIQKAINVAKIAVANAKIVGQTKEAYDSAIKFILMIGGTSKIPLVTDLLTKEFKITDNTEISISFSKERAQQMVVGGAAVIGGGLKYTCSRNAAYCNENNRKELNLILKNVIPLNIGFNICRGTTMDDASTKCGVMSIIVPKNTRYPVEKTDSFCQKKPESTEALVEVYEGDAESVERNYQLGNVRVNNIKPRKEGECPDNILANFKIDKDGIADITVTTVGENDKLTDFKLQLPLTKDSSFSDIKIKLMQRDMYNWYDEIDRMVIYNEIGAQCHKYIE